MTSYTTNIVTAPANIIVHIIHTAFERIATAPYYKYIVDFVDKTCKNYRAVPSRLGSSAHGMHGAIFSAVMYEIQAPVSPDAHPVVLIDSPTIAPDTTEQDKCQIRADHRTDQEESAVLTPLENFTKAGAIRAISKTYLVELRDGNLGMDHMTVQELFAYLLVSYGMITVTDLEADRSNIVSPFNFVDPIKMLFSKLERGKQYATDGRDPFSVIQLRNMALQ